MHSVASLCVDYIPASCCSRTISSVCALAAWNSSSLMSPAFLRSTRARMLSTALAAESAARAGPAAASTSRLRASVVCSTIAVAVVVSAEVQEGVVSASAKQQRRVCSKQQCVRTIKCVFRQQQQLQR
eukprot:4982-Heterococcus_DN1.PRE.1